MVINYYYHMRSFQFCFPTSLKWQMLTTWHFLLPHHSGWASWTLPGLPSTDSQAADSCLSACSQNAVCHSDMPSSCLHPRNSWVSWFFAQGLPLKSRDYFLKTPETTPREIFSRHREIRDVKQRNTFSPLTLKTQRDFILHRIIFPYHWTRNKKATYKD